MILCMLQKKKYILNEKLIDEFQKRIRGSLCCITYARKGGNFLGRMYVCERRIIVQRKLFTYASHESQRGILA